MTIPTHAPQLPYFLGCPVWACPGWVGSIFASDAKRSEYLHQYSMAFNTVEGNSTFYGLPTRATAANWCEQSLPGFRFALKFPRVITHERQLRGAEPETRAFLSLLEVLATHDRLGPSFLQLSPSFSGAQLPDLAAFLRELPEEFPFAVEVRHPDFFEDSPVEQQLQELLVRLQMDRVLFETRPLFSAAATDESEAEAQRRKPRTATRPIVSGQRPMLRFVGRNDVAASAPWIAEWVPEVADWIRRGLTPYVFLHAPDDRFAPDLAQAFHTALSAQLPDLPPLPRGRGTILPPAPRQRTLF